RSCSNYFTRRSCSTKAAGWSFSDADGNASLFCRSRTPASVRRGSRCLSVVRDDATGIYLRRTGNAAARFERRHYLRGEQPRPVGGGSPLFAGVLARQVRSFSPDPRRQTSFVAPRTSAAAAIGTGAKP